MVLKAKLLRHLLSPDVVRKGTAHLIGKRGEGLYLSLIFHAEKIQEERVYRRLCQFGRFLSSGYHFRTTLCLMTPQNPYLQCQMRAGRISEKEYRQRVKSLSQWYDLGFHGHWCKSNATNMVSPGLIPEEYRKLGFGLTLAEPQAIEEQFRAEVDYLSTNFYPPKVYTAGWWYLSEQIINLLDEHRFDIDCSVRYGRKDTFGGHYLPPDQLPEQGYLFHPYPAKRLMEVPSIAYLHMNWWTIIRDLLPVLKASRRPLFSVLPLHDYNLLDGLEKIQENVAFLAHIKNVHWVEVTKMPSLAKGVIG
jgi:hypothetical protein